MSGRRDDEDHKKTRFRSDRFFCEGGKWYFSTRENTTKGPYESREDAEAELMLYLRELQTRENFGAGKS